MNGAFYDFVNGLPERRMIGPLRDELLRDLQGEIVDVGAGTGGNFGYHRAGMHVLALDVNAALAVVPGAYLPSGRGNPGSACKRTTILRQFARKLAENANASGRKIGLEKDDAAANIGYFLRVLRTPRFKQRLLRM